MKTIYYLKNQKIHEEEKDFMVLVEGREIEVNNLKLTIINNYMKKGVMHVFCSSMA